MIYLANPSYLLIIALIPVFYLCYGLYVRIRKNRIKKFGNPQLIDQIIPRYSRSRGWLKLTIFSLAFFFFLLGMARPQLGVRLKEKELKGSEIMVVLDVSNSMLAEDYYPNRLERAKLAISRLVDRLRGDRVGLIVFAGQSFVQLPITADYISAKIFLNTISTLSVPVQGTAMGDAIFTAIKSFSMDSENSRAIILITDGENHEDDPVEAAKEALNMGIRVFCIGVGSPEGKPIPMNGELLKDKDGNIVVTRLEEGILYDVAEAGNGLYVRAGNAEFGLNPIIENIKEMEQREYKSLVFEDFDEQYMYFFAIALILLVLDMIIGNRSLRRKFFN